MPAKSCGHCLEWTTSNDTLLDALHGRWRARVGCEHQPLMRVAIEQFKRGQPFWWVVGTAVVVPVWIVERITKRERTLAGADSSTVCRADLATLHAGPGSTGFARLLETTPGVDAVPATELLDVGFELHARKSAQVVWR